MASPMFEVYDRNLRRIYWLCFIDDQLSNGKRSSFKASLVVNAHTGKPIQHEERASGQVAAKLRARPAAAG